MTVNTVTDDQKQKPNAEQISTYTRRESELRQRYLKGVLDFGVVLEGLQKLMEMTRGFINCNIQPEIPGWADQENPIIQHVPCGMVASSRIIVADVFLEGETFLYGEDYIARAQKVDGAMNACAFDFYVRPENWKYLPEGVDVIVFPKTIFRLSGGSRFVRFLYRGGSEWFRDCCWLGRRFRRDYRVAALASPLVLEVKAS